MIAVSLDGKMVKVCVFIPISTLTFFGQESHRPHLPPILPKSEGARTPTGKIDLYFASLL